MMHWVIPAKINGEALGNSTFSNICQRVAPNDSPASTNARGTLEIFCGSGRFQLEQG